MNRLVSLKKVFFAHTNLMIYLALLCIMLGGLAVRLFAIDQLRLTHDEMSIGYNAYAIAQTGRDEWGEFLPLAFKAFGDWKLPGYIYATVPFVALFGLSTLTVKAASLVSGLALIAGLFYTTRALTKSWQLGLVAATLTAFSPWTIHLSRMGLESNLALALFVWGTYCAIQLMNSSGQHTKQWWRWAVALGILWGLTFYTYVAFRLIVVLMSVGLSVLLWRRSTQVKNQLKLWIVALVSFFVVIAPLTPLLFGQSGTARFSQVSLFSDEGVASQVNHRRSYCHLVEPTYLPTLCQLVFNKPQVYGEKFFSNYVKFLLPTFLFLEGDQLEYLSNPGFGEFAWVLLPFYIIGATYWLKRGDTAANLMKIGFFVAPIPSAMVGSPQIVRGSAVAFFVIFFTVFGCSEVWKLLKHSSHKLLLTLGVGGLFIFLTAHYLVHYLAIYPREYQAYLYPLGPEVGQYLLDHADEYDTIYITDDFADAHILIAFLAAYDPTKYREQVVVPEPDSAGFQHPTKLGKFEFLDRQGEKLLCDDQIQNVLYVTGPTEEIPHTLEFKGFSGVHSQAKLMDIDHVRKNLLTTGAMKERCPAWE